MKLKDMHNEAGVKINVKLVLKAQPNIWWYMPQAGSFGTQGIPDFVGIYKGRGFAVEAKFGKGVLTEWQKIQRDTVIAAGGKYWLVNETNVAAFAQEFEAWACS